jgi:hypothetical protein
MFTAATENTTAIRNYALAAVTVMLVSVGVSDLFSNPARFAQQDRLDGYGRYVSAGLVSKAQSLSR